MFERILPQPIDNTYHGRKLALWLFAVIVLVKTVQSFAIMFNGETVLTSADGIPLDAYTPASAQTVLAIWTLSGLERLIIAWLCMLVLVRYRSLVTFMFVLLAVEYLARQLVLYCVPIVRVGTPPGPVVNFVLFCLMIVGLALSAVEVPQGPRMKRTVKISLLRVLLLGIAMPGPASAEELQSAVRAAAVTPPASSEKPPHTWEFEPRPGERRFNRFIYKASHNSFEREESLAEQMDVWNVWSLELDLWSYRGQIFVSHENPCGIGCCPCDVPSLETELDEIVASVTKHGRVTLIDLQLHLPTSDAQSFYAQIETAFRARLGSERIYCPIEFAASPPRGDGMRWPSHQEMVRRGKHFIVVAHPAPEHPFFFRTTTSSPPAPDESPNAILVVVENARAPAGDLGDRYLSRTWRASCTGFPDIRQHCNCEIEDDFWNRSVRLGFNFIATYCVNRAWTMTAPTHSPVPIYVTSTGNPSLPMYGTSANPFRGPGALTAAADRATPMAEIRVSPGVYDFGTAGPWSFTAPAVLYKNSANVLIESRFEPKAGEP